MYSQWGEGNPKAFRSVYSWRIDVIAIILGQQKPEVDVCFRTKDTPLFLKIWFLGLPKQCLWVLLIGADKFSHLSLNLTYPPPPLPINYNKKWNGWQPRLACGKQNKDHYKIRCRRVDFMCVMSYCCVHVIWWFDLQSYFLLLSHHTLIVFFIYHCLIKFILSACCYCDSYFN